MRLTDFVVGVLPPKAGTRRRRVLSGSGFPDPGRLNQRLAPIGEAVRWELAGERVDAPFGKLSINLYNPDARGPVEANRQNVDSSDPSPIVLIDLAFVGAALSPAAASADRAALTTQVTEACRAAVTALAASTSWSPSGLLSVIDRVGGSDPPFHRLWGARNLRGAKGRVELWYDITDRETTLTVRQVDRAGDVVHEEVVAHVPKPAAIDWWLPLHSFAIHDGSVVLRDKAKRPVAIQAGFEAHGATVKPTIALA